MEEYKKIFPAKQEDLIPDKEYIKARKKHQDWRWTEPLYNVYINGHYIVAMDWTDEWINKILYNKEKNLWKN